MEEKPKIIIDEDWKSQALAEKEALEKQLQTAGAAPTGADQPQSAAADAEPAPPLPEANLTLLFSMLGTQALSAFGQMPGPEGSEPTLDLDYARHVIDLLQVLEDKTRGNRTPQETSLLESMLHELRMLFVAFRDQLQQTATPG